MASQRSQNKIDQIMGDAYEKAFAVLAEEVRKFMRADPRFVEYVHAVGWGPAFYTRDGDMIEWAHKMPTKRGKKMLEWCDQFYDTYGAGNERVALLDAGGAS